MFALLMMAAAPVQPPLRLETAILAEKNVAAADGTTRVVLVKPDRVGPGDAMLVRVGYRNVGGQPLDGVTIANPLPAGLGYRAAAEGAVPPEVSVDGEHYGPLGALRVALPGGGSRAATARDVSHVRWRLATPLGTGGGGQFAFRAVVK